MKTRALFVAITALALTACSGGNSTPSTPANNPSSITVTTTVVGTATSGISVTLSTGLSGTPSEPTGVVQTLTSDSNGQIVFDTGIPTTGKLCLWSTYSTGTQAQTLASCHSQPHPASATINFTI